MDACPMQVPHADRCRRMSSTPAVCARDLAGESILRGIHANQGGSQINPARPSTRKNGRHPKRPTAFPPNHMPSAGPSAKPTMSMELAKPR
jgi:hypothetical protein